MKKIIIASMALAFIGAANAEDQLFGKWRVLGGGNGVAPMALTTNDSDNGFGQVCSDDTEGCFWLVLSPKTPCQDGTQIPILANSSSGSISLNALCNGVFEFGKTKYHRYIISPYSEVTKIVEESSGLISFAVPVGSGSFTVMRFDLSGSSKAISRFSDLVTKYYKKTSSTKDISL